MDGVYYAGTVSSGRVRVEAACRSWYGPAVWSRLVETAPQQARQIREKMERALDAAAQAGD